MELIFKLPEGKLPFLGILYENIYDATKTNQDLVENFPDVLFTIHLEINGGMNIRIVNESPPIVRSYPSLKFDAAKFFAWKRMVKDRVNFGHVLKKNDKDVIAQTLTGRKNFVLKIGRIHFHHEY